MHISGRRFTGSTLGSFGNRDFAARPIAARSGPGRGRRQPSPASSSGIPSARRPRPMAIVILAPRSARLCVSRRHPDRGLDLRHRPPRARDADRGVHDPAKRRRPPLEPVQPDAPMPFHRAPHLVGGRAAAGNLPGYPDSHGCVHLPLEFSKLLFHETQLGVPVIIADATTACGGSAPGPAVERGDRARRPGRRGEQRDRRAGDDSDSSGGKSGRRWKDAAPPGPLVFDRRRQQALRTRGQGRDRRLAGHDRRSRRAFGHPCPGARRPERRAGAMACGWRRQGGHERPGRRCRDPRRAIELQIPTDVANRLQPLLRPGTTVMITDLPATADTRSGKDFVVLAQGDVLSAEARARPVSSHENGPARAQRWRGSSTSRRPSPKGEAGDTIRIAIPGIVATHHLLEQVLPPGRDHGAPFGQRLGAEAEEAEARGGQDDARHVERQAHDQGRGAQRHDVPPDDPRARSAWRRMAAMKSEWRTVMVSARAIRA